MLCDIKLYYVSPWLRSTAGAGHPKPPDRGQGASRGKGPYHGVKGPHMAVKALYVTAIVRCSVTATVVLLYRLGEPELHLRMTKTQ